MDEIEDVQFLNDVESIDHQSGKKTNVLKIILLVVAVIAILGLIVFSAISLFRMDLETTSKVRDIFIIIMAFESLLLGVALVILIIQVAVLINILKNDVKQLMDTTQETVSHLRGTTTFLSNNLVEPVIKLNEYSAGMKKFFDLIIPLGKTRRKN